MVRCEPDSDRDFHCDALVDRVPGALVCDLPAGDEPSLDGIDRVFISGSTAGVYEDDHDWLPRGRDLVQRLVERGTPTLAVCFGHQLVHDALGGRVEADRFRAGLVTAQFGDDPLFEGVSPVVPVIHGDVVVEPGAGLSPIATVREYEYPLFATRHERAPLWTVQFHPELGPAQRPTLTSTFDWDERDHSFDAVTGERVFENFRRATASALAGRRSSQ